MYHATRAAILSCMTRNYVLTAGLIAALGLTGTILTVNHRATDPQSEARIYYLTTLEVNYRIHHADAVRVAGQVCAADWETVGRTLLEITPAEYRATAAARRALVKTVTRLAPPAYCPAGAAGG